MHALAIVFLLSCFWVTAADFKRMEVPDQASALIFISGVTMVALQGTWVLHAWSLLYGALFLLVWFLRGVGGGDVKLAFALVPWLDLLTYTYVLIFACVSAFLYGAARLTRRGQLLVWAACLRAGLWEKLPEEPKKCPQAVPLAAFMAICAGLAVAYQYFIL